MAPGGAGFLPALFLSLLLPLPTLPQHLRNSKSSLANTSQTRPPCFTPSADLSPSTFRVLVPNRTTFTQFVDCSDPNYVRGFSVDVFNSAWDILQPAPTWEKVEFQCFNMHSTHSTYDDLVECLLDGSVDAIVGDVTIGARRMEIASFTQPYVASGIVILAPTVAQRNPFPGVFFAPFTAGVWSSIGVSAVVTGAILWWLEKDPHAEPKRGHMESLWFVTQLLVFFKRETLTNVQAKAVLVGWIAFILVLGSAYTASFTAILTVRKIAPDNYNIQTLPNETFRIGYQIGSIVYDYLTQTLGIRPGRLLSLNSTNDYLEALEGQYQDGGVALVIDEVPYVNLFLSGLPSSSCEYMVVGQKLTNEGFGFAFPLGSENLSKAFSMAILNLSEAGELQKLQIGAQISDYECPSQIQATQLDLISSYWLFVLLGLVLVACVMLLMACNWGKKRSDGETKDPAVADGSDASELNESELTFMPERRLLRLGTFPPMCRNSSIIH